MVMFAVRPIRLITERGGVILLNLNLCDPLYFKTTSVLQSAGNSCQHSTMLSIYLPRRRASLLVHARFFWGGAIAFFSPDGQGSQVNDYTFRSLFKFIYLLRLRCGSALTRRELNTLRFQPSPQCSTMQMLAFDYRFKTVVNINAVRVCFKSLQRCSICKVGSLING